MKLTRQNQVELFSEPLELFRRLITKAIENQNVSVKEDVEYYLVSLLTQFMKANVSKQSAQDPLALKLHKAMLSNKIERIRILKEMGDFSLYIAGFFSDSLRRKLVDVDYYMAMGGAAYFKLSHNMAQAALQDLYQDLFQHFGTYVDILNEVSDEAFSHSNRDVLRMYERWLKTRSQRLADLLKKEGILLTPSSFKARH